MCDNNNNNNNKLENNQENPSHVSSENNGGGFQAQDHQTPNFPLQNMMQQNMINGLDAFFADGGPGPALAFPDDSPQILPWNFPHPFGPAHFPARDPDPFLLPPPPPGLFSPRRPFGYESGPSSDHHLRLITESLGHVAGPAGPFGLHAELQKMTAQEIMDAKALAASKSHSEAERRRRERINNHLAKLRSLLPSTTKRSLTRKRETMEQLKKTDKASLLAEVIQHVKELKRQTSLISETSAVPTETDEVTVDSTTEDLIRASICCEDRPDLLPDLIKALKGLRLKTLKAEITTLGGRVKNVLFVTGEEGSDQPQPVRVSSIEEALKAVVERGGGEESSVKRQRTNSVNIS
ncbi:basic helix-loop-helix (bHLH) DNA-bindingsuperfamily protein [Striga asiatica]|uniref:Basic helix-loop-helix (BHLH) DNA-bindingsuperfamily protein n=1 Tax=Striga asiatica TaxID=4170 RepID=A0A5A7PHZ8_STRAF|nr:basic helix-loop-helix (bHLH) DNA-bindingsuperfamily protein [Striga asiatica]